MSDKKALVSMWHDGEKLIKGKTFKKKTLIHLAESEIIQGHNLFSLVKSEENIHTDVIIWRGIVIKLTNAALKNGPGIYIP